MGLCEKYNRKSLNEPMGELVMEAADSICQNENTKIKKLSLLEKAVVAVLDYKPLSLTSIYESLDAESRRRYPIAQVSVTLVELCIKNLAKQAGAGYYTRS